MVSLKQPDRHLPSRDICYAYAVAMHFAQQFELNLRAILYSADYHGWIPNIELSKCEKKRFENSEEFIDNATCGRLISALKKTAWIKNKKVFTVFQKACEHRNKLAHYYLTLYDFDNLTKGNERKIIQELNKFAIDLYGGLLISRSIRERADVEADKLHKSLASLVEELGISNYDNSDRKYSTRKKK